MRQARSPGPVSLAGAKGEPLNWQVPETLVVGLMDGSGFLGWPASCGLAHVGLSDLSVSVHLCGKGERVLLLLCLGAPQQLK